MKKQMKRILFSSLIIVSGFGISSSFAQEQAELGTRELLISKLERVSLNLAPNDPSKVAVSLRLADLLSERARELSMKELESGCTICTAGEKDRAKALNLYQEVLPKVPLVNLGRVMIQVGHLHELNGNQPEAIQYYEKTKAEIHDPVLKSEAALSLAEVYFKKNQFPKALENYQEVIKEKAASSRGLAAYRAAWCHFNMAQLSQATEQLKVVLKTPELQSRSGIADSQADQQFLEEVARDLASFIAKQPFNMKEVEELVSLSPVTTKQQNLISMALEMERLGKRKESAEVWSYALNQEAKPEVRLEALVHLVPLKFDEKNTEASYAQMQQVSALWTQLNGCGQKDCADQQKILRAFIVNWNQTEKKAPSENLVKTYGLYLAQFSHDLEVMTWAADAARLRKDYVQSCKFLELAAGEAKQADKLENILLTLLETSEASQDKALWLKEADLYLSKSVKQTKIYEVRYQQAKMIYDQNEPAKSAELLQALALNEKAPMILRLQSAHLSLDALVLAKDEAKLAETSQIYSQKFTGHDAAVFAGIHQKTILSQVAELAKTNDEQAYLALEKFEAAKASIEDKKIFLKNKILLAEKTNRHGIASSTVDEYLALQGLSSEEKDFALGRKAWLAEMRLDFSTAFKSLQMMPQKTLAPDQKALKLAIYAELAGAGSQNYYQQFLQLSKDEEAKRSVAAELIRKNKDSEKELERNMNIIAKDPELLARLDAEIFSKMSTGPAKEKFLTKTSSDPRIQKTAWGKTIQRYALLQELLPYNDRLAAMKLDSVNQKALTKSIKARGQEMTKLEAATAKAIKAGDWSAQVVAMTVLGRESKRFYEELMALPMPEGLSPEEEGQYMQLLSQQSAPYKNRSDEATTKLNEFWSVAGWKEALQKSLSDAGEFQVFVELEIRALAKVTVGEAYQDQQTFISGLQQQEKSASEQRVAFASLESARNEVRSNPQSREKLENLKSLESQAKNFAMVHYLEGRLKNLETQSQEKK